MDQRRLAKGNDALYNFLDREIRQECKAAKENMLAAPGNVIGLPDAAHTSNLVHSLIRLVIGRNRRSHSTTCIEDNEGNTITENVKIVSGLSKYISELYNDDRWDMLEIVAEVESPFTQPVEHALRRMSMKRSLGPDDITTKMLVGAGDIRITELIKLANMIYIQGSFPRELNKYIVIALPKVNGIVKCEKHCTISLMSHVAKLSIHTTQNFKWSRYTLTTVTISQLKTFIYLLETAYPRTTKQLTRTYNM